MKRDLIIYYDSAPSGLALLRLAVEEGDDVFLTAHHEAKHRKIPNFFVMAWEALDDAREAFKRLDTPGSSYTELIRQRAAELRMQRDYGGRRCDPNKLPDEMTFYDTVRMSIDPALGPDQMVIATVHDEVIIMSISPAETPFVRKYKATRAAEKKQALAAAYGKGPDQLVEALKYGYLKGDWVEPKPPEESKALPALAGLGVVSDTFTGRLGNRWQP